MQGSVFYSIHLYSTYDNDKLYVYIYISIYLLVSWHARSSPPARRHSCRHSCCSCRRSLKIDYRRSATFVAMPRTASSNAAAAPTSTSATSTSTSASTSSSSTPRLTRSRQNSRPGTPSGRITRSSSRKHSERKHKDNVKNNNKSNKSNNKYKKVEAADKDDKNDDDDDDEEEEEEDMVPDSQKTPTKKSSSWAKVVLSSATATATAAQSNSILQLNRKRKRDLDEPEDGKVDN